MTTKTNLSSVLNPTPIIPQFDIPIGQLPLELIPQIIARLPAYEVGTASLVCREWYRAFEHDGTFQSIFSYQFPTIDQNTVTNFKNFYHFYSNLTKGVYASHTFNGHESSVCSLVVDGQTLFSGSWDNTIKAWDIKTRKCIATFNGHEESVLSIAVAGQTLFSGSGDYTIKAWDIKTGECIATLEGHEDSVLSIAVVGQTLFSGSYDKTIKAWDIKTGECIATFKGHKKSVYSLAVVGQTLFSGSGDYTIKAWDIKTGECIATFKGHEHWIYSLAVVGQTLFSGSRDYTIKAWDIKTGDCIATFKGREHSVGSLYSIAVAGPTLFSGSGDNKIKAWDIKTGDCIATFQGQSQSSFIHSLALAGQTLFSGSLDHTLKAWNFTADHTEIFIEIARLLETGTPQATQEALERFSKMPIRARKTICAILHDILDDGAPLTTVEINERAARPEDIFYDKCEQRSAISAQKAQAILEYLIIPSLHQISSSKFSATGKRTHDTAFGTQRNS